MIHYTVTDLATNATIRTGTAMTEAQARLQGSAPGTKVTLVGSDPKTEIIDPGTGMITDRLPMRNQNGLTQADKTNIRADGVDMVTIHYVPNGAICEVFLPSNRGLMQPADAIVTDGVVYITTTVPGMYQVVLHYQNFLDFGVTFNAN